MNIRHLATKVLGKTVELDKSIVYNNLPLSFSAYRDNKSAEELVIFNRRDKVELSGQVKEGQDRLKASPINGIIFGSDGDALTLSQLFDFKVRKDGFLGDILPEGASFSTILNNSDIRNFMIETSTSMFGLKNPLTGDVDIESSDECAEYIPLVIITGVMKPQIDEDGNVFFNRDGVVSVSDFLDSLSCLTTDGSYEDANSLDLVSSSDDYFYQGYKSCLHGFSSPFFNLYTRDELMEPITRVELAYLLVVCWERFIAKFNGAYSNSYNLGINFDWENPLRILEKFEDGFDYKISRVNVGDKVLSLNIKDYKGDMTMTYYKDAMVMGEKPIPVPLFMSMLELEVLNIFPYSEAKLNPLAEVTRGELSIIMTRLAEQFPTKYIG